MKKEETTLLILAAGMGSRYGGLKQIDPFGPGEHSLIEYTIYDAIQIGFTSFVFIVRPEIEDTLRNYFSQRLPDTLNVQFVVQRLNDLPESYLPPQDRKKPWGTSHAVFSARDAVSTPFAVVNCDDYYGRSALEHTYVFLQQASAYEYAVIGYPLHTTLSPHGSVSRGVCYPDEQGFLKRIVEQPRIVKKDAQVISIDEDDKVLHTFQGNEPVSMNLFGFMPSFFSLVERALTSFLETAHTNTTSELYIPKVVNTLLNEQKISMNIIPSEEQWFGVTYREDRDAAQKILQKKVNTSQYPLMLWNNT